MVIFLLELKCGNTAPSLIYSGAAEDRDLEFEAKARPGSRAGRKWWVGAGSDLEGTLVP